MFQRRETFALAALFIAATVTGCDRASASSPPSAAAQSPARDRVAEGRAMVDQGATLLDVRTADEYASGHLDRAVLLPVQELEGRMSEVPRDRPVVVYCRSGARSAAAASMLVRAGYRVHDIGPMPSASRWSR
jgi:rhodanese-related sulfurtransferase